ncbi:hypothetical protein BGZ98_004786 [Dissophora globulifera]|nr:hypothetical protein BGZ98_004786 [Dissophora globulifera]
MAYQPYSSQQQLQHPLPSPSIIDPYRTSSPAYSSPGLSPLHTGGHSVYDDLSMPSVQVRSEHTKVDPYRSAYSQSANNHASNNTSHPYGSPYQGSGRGSPNPNEDFSSSFESRFSSMSTQQLQQQNASSNTVTNSNNNNNPRYPRDLVGQDSIYKAVPLSELTAQLPAPPKRAATISSDRAVTASASDKDLASTSVDMSAGQTRPSTLNPSRPSKSDTSGTTKKTTTDEEDEENDVILQKLGVLSADSSGNGSRSGTRSGITYGSGRSRRKGQWTDESEEESQDRRSEASRPQLRRLDRRGTTSQRRRRDAQRRCLCCSARVCLYITFALFICVATALYFIIPRSPAFGFESVAPLGPPVVTTNRIQEPFTVQLMVDSRSNYLPIRLNSIDLSILLKMDQSKIANNDNLPSAFVIQPRMAQIISIPMTLDYNSVGSDQNTDSTLQLLVAACKPFDPVDANSVAPSIDLTVSGSLHVWGLSWVWKPSFDFNVDRVPCPANTKDLGGQTSTSVPSAPVQPVPSATAFVASAPQPSGASFASVQAKAAIMTSSIAAAPAEPPLYRRANRRRARMTEAVPTPLTAN